MNTAQIKRVIRGMDTVGEVTVLATAGLGVVALARAGRPPRTRHPQRSRSGSQAVDEVAVTE